MWIFLVQKKINFGIFDKDMAFLFRKMWYFHLVHFQGIYVNSLSHCVSFAADNT